MIFDIREVLGKAKVLLGNLSPQASNVAVLDGKKIKSICSSTFHAGFNGQFHCTTPVRSRSVPQTVYVSESENVRGLSPDQSVQAGQKELLANASNLLDNVFRYVKRAPIWYYRAAVGEHRRLRAGVNLYVGAADKHNIRLPYMARIMFPVPQFNEMFERNFTLLFLPEFEKPAILVFPELNFTIVLGSGYFGELKKGILRMLWYEASFRDILGLHASTKIVNTKAGKQLAVVTLGLSGTGKTTSVMTVQTGFQAICQDDFVGLDLKKLAIWGTELGLFLKTEGVTSESQPEIYEALLDSRAFWENVFIDSNGNPDFCNLVLTKNGRGVTPRTALPREAISTSIDIDLKEVDGVVFLMCTRHNVNPILQKLTPEQFAAAFALGHTTGTSAGGTAEAGKEKFIEGTNPFIIRQPGHDSDILLQGLRKLQEAEIPVICLVLNTGYTGEVKTADGIVEEAIDISIADCSLVLAAVWEEKVEYTKCPWLKTELPCAVDGVSRRVLQPQISFSGQEQYYLALLAELNLRCQQKLASMNFLNKEILQAGLEMHPVS